MKKRFYDTNKGSRKYYARGIRILRNVFIIVVILCVLSGGFYLFAGMQQKEKHMASDVQKQRTDSSVDTAAVKNGSQNMQNALQKIQNAAVGLQNMSEEADQAVGSRQETVSEKQQPVSEQGELPAVIQNEEERQQQQEQSTAAVPEASDPKQSADDQEMEMAQEYTETTTNAEYFLPCLVSADIFARIQGLSYKETCSIPLEELRYIQVLHTGFDGRDHVGELIVNRLIAEDVCAVFRELYEIRYPIEKIRLVDEYGADDNRSMADNNSSAFNYRVIDGTERLSNHAKGFAIDINPLYNPYIRTQNGVLQVLPDNAYEYADRTKEQPYYIRKGDPCYQIFKSHGFTWGGEWKNSKDYQHFEKVIRE